MNIVITGATGMIGHSLIVKCLERGAAVHAVVRDGSKNLCRIEHMEGLRIIRCGIGQYDRLPGLIGAACDVFYHLAWTDAGRHAQRSGSSCVQMDNIGYTYAAVEAAHKLGCRTFVGAGSQAEFGAKEAGSLSPDDPVRPVQPYGIAKYAAGRMAAFLAGRYGMNCFWVRIFSVYGMHDRKDTLIMYTIDRLLRGEVPEYTPAGQNWDYLYCMDAAEALYRVGMQKCGSRVYCLGSGAARPLKEYIKIIRDAVDPGLPVRIGAFDYPEGTVMNLCADISELQKDTGWMPEMPFEAGIRSMLRHMGGHFPA